MIVDLGRFVAERKQRWEELDKAITALESNTPPREIEALERIVRLYEMAAADLNRLSTFASAPKVQAHLEALVARAYAELYDPRVQAKGEHSPFQIAVRLLASEFPQAVRRRLRPILLAIAVMFVGGIFGMSALALDPGAKSSLMPFEHLLGDPSDRVREEESRGDDSAAAGSAAFSAQLMQNNIRVSILCLALGISWGIGTIIVLFYNGTLLGAVVFDYIQAGEGVFLAGWLLPHGIIEIPAIFLAGGAGLVIARALFPDRSGGSIGDRLREIRADLVALIAGVAAMLVWAGIIEAFFSQLHEPYLPYSIKIAFGVVEGIALLAFLSLAGRGSSQPETAGGEPRR